MVSESERQIPIVMTNKPAIKEQEGKGEPKEQDKMEQ